MRQAFAGAHAGVEGEEPEFSSGDEGGWESLPTRTAKPTRCCEAARRAQHRRMRQAFAGAHADCGVRSANSLRATRGAGPPPYKTQPGSTVRFAARHKLMSK